MTDLTMTTFNAALKELYTDQRVLNLVYRDSPMLALLPKNTNWGGKNQPIPVQSGVVKGASTNFVAAQTNAQPGNYEAFAVTGVEDYAVATIAGKVMRMSDGDTKAFLRAAKVEVDGALRILSRRLSHRIFADGTGWIGRIAAITNATPSVITLGSGSGATAVADPEVVVHFERGMVLEAAAADGTTRANGAIAGSGTAYGVGDRITVVDRDLGKISMTSDLIDGTGDWEVNDFLFVQGDRASTTAVPVTGARSTMAGFAAWFPDSAPGATAFFGVDRSVDTTRLGGIRFKGGGLSVEEALIRASWRGRREGAKFTHAVMNPKKMADLITSQADKARYDTAKSPDAPAISVPGIRLMLPGSGDLLIIADENCPVERCYMLSMPSLKLCSAGPIPGFLEHDGMRLLRVSNADSVEVRAGWYGNMTCDSPRDNLVIKFDEAAD